MDQLGLDAKTAASLENPHSAITISPSNSRYIYNFKKLYEYKITGV